jgi:hypothetical protein
MSEIKYCSKCGAELEIIVSGKVHYDNQTGEQIARVKMHCPNRRWFLDGHDSWDGDVGIKTGFKLDVKYYDF